MAQIQFRDQGPSGSPRDWPQFRRWPIALHAHSSATAITCGPAASHRQGDDIEHRRGLLTPSSPPEEFENQLVKFDSVAMFATTNRHEFERGLHFRTRCCKGSGRDQFASLAQSHIEDVSASYSDPSRRAMNCIERYELPDPQCRP